MTKKVHVYRGQDINILYDAKRCIHVEECIRGLSAVFDMKQRRWVQPDQAAADKVAEVVARCPTGALQFELQDGGAAEPIPENNTIIPEPDGPLFLFGDIKIASSDGDLVYKEIRVALCRCGATKNIPFCDGSHRKVVFMNSGQLGENRLRTTNPATAVQGLIISLRPNGPLLLKGKVKIQSADGKIVYRGDKGALCRCGSSQNKPFCDGSHVRVGFKSD